MFYGKNYKNACVIHKSLAIIAISSFKNSKINMKDQIAKLLNTKVDRKGFLKYTAAAGLMTVGGGMLVKSFGNLDKLSQGSSPSAPTTTTGAYGYGASAYGGDSMPVGK